MKDPKKIINVPVPKEIWDADLSIWNWNKDIFGAWAKSIHGVIEQTKKNTMKDPNKYGVYWVAKEKGKPVDHGLMCIAEDKHYAEIIQTALSSITENAKDVEYIVATDYPF